MASRRGYRERQARTTSEPARTARVNSVVGQPARSALVAKTNPNATDGRRRERRPGHRERLVARIHLVNKPARTAMVNERVVTEPAGFALVRQPANVQVTQPASHALVEQPYNARVSEPAYQAEVSEPAIERLQCDTLTESVNNGIRPTNNGRSAGVTRTTGAAANAASGEADDAVAIAAEKVQ